MKRSPGLAFLLWLLAMLIGAGIVWNSRFSADMSFFLPKNPTPEQQVLVDQLKEGAVSRLLMLAVEGGSASQRATISHELRNRLAVMPEFLSVQNGETGSMEADRDFLFRNRYLLSAAVTPERFSVSGLQSAISDSIDRLASPAGMMLKPLLQSDPTGELFQLIGSLGAGAQPNSREGVWASRDGERAMLLVQTRAKGSDTDGQATAIAIIRQQFADILGTRGINDARLQLSGPGFFAVKARASIQEEIGHLSLVSTTAIVALLFFVYRSFRLVALGLLPVVSGALAGIVAVSLVHGTVFGITVGFGSALIGEAVDYSIYYFVQSRRMGIDAWRVRFWPTVRLGVLTSVAGFAALLFSGFPGLAQLGLYSLAGVLAAAAVTRFVLPQLVTNTASGCDLTRPGKALGGAIKALGAWRGPMLLLAILAATSLFANRDNLWHPNLSALSTVSEEDSAIDMALRADISAPDSRYLVVINAADRESALVAAERAGEKLDALIGSNVIGGYDSPARFLPSLATQAARRASLPDSDTLRARLQLAQADSPLAAGKLDAFLRDIASSKAEGKIDRNTLDGSNLALAVDSLLMRLDNGWSVLLPLRPPLGSDGLQIASETVRQALAGSGALLIDLKGEFDRLYNNYLHEAVILSLAGLIGIVVLLAVTLRSATRVASVMLPLILSVILVIAGLNLLGERLHLLHLVGMLLIVAVGSNYALFFNRAEGEHQLDPETLASMLIANLATAIGFGTLALSKVPVLHAIGVTVGPGAILALLLSAIFVPRETKR